MKKRIKLSLIFTTLTMLEFFLFLVHIYCNLLYLTYFLYYICYNSKFKVESGKKSYIEFIQENLMEFQLQECLFYIHLANSLYYTKSSLLSRICIIYTIHIWYNTISESSTSFYNMWHVIITRPQSKLSKRILYQN